MSALTTWLTAIADAIRGKDGTEDPIDHADFPAKITAIPQLDTSDATATESDILLGETAYAGGVKLTGTNTNNADTTDATLTANDMLYGVTGYGADGTKLTGAGAYWQNATGLRGVFLDNSDLTGAVVIRSPKCTVLYQTFSGCANIRSVDLTFGAVTGLTGFYAIFTDCTSLETVILQGSTALATSFGALFSGCAALVTVSGALDLTSATSVSNMFRYCAALVNITITQSSIKVSLSFFNSPLLSNASLLSIANGLDGTAVGQTLTMHATSKTNMDAIMVDNNAGVAELGSTMTLTQFINNIKGWTIA